MNLFLKIFTLTISFVLLFNSTAFADPGEFYEKHKAEFDKAEAYTGDYYMENIVKKYDDDTNTFDCGKFELDCTMASFEFKFALGMVNASEYLIGFLLRDPETIISDKGLNRYKGYLDSLAWSLLPFFLLWHIMVITIRRLGDPDDYMQALNQKLVSLFGAGVMLALYPLIFRMILQLQEDIIGAILSNPIDADSLKVMIFSWSPKFTVILFLFVLLSVFVFALALLYRFVGLAFMFMVGPLAISTMLNDEFNYFNVWLKYIVSVIVTFALQCMAFVMSLQALTGENAFIATFPVAVQPIAAISLTFVITFFSLAIPFILGNLGNSTGTGRSIGRISRVVLKK